MIKKPYSYIIFFFINKTIGFKLNISNDYFLKKTISSYIEKKFPKLEGKEDLIKKCFECYQRSQEFYGPVAVKWTDYLLKKADSEKKKIICLARDGTPIFKLASEVLNKNKEKYPNLKPEDLSLAYISRKINNDLETNEDKDLLSDYLKQLGLKKDDKCIFVDIGYNGKVIEMVKNNLSKITSHEPEFEYLISWTKKAKGFIANGGSDLKGIPFLGSNRAIHWLEDTHQGAKKSPTALIRTKDGIYPNTLLPGKKETYSSEPHEYIIRKFGQKAIANMSEIDGENIDLQKSINKLDELFVKLKDNKLPLYIVHISDTPGRQGKVTV